MTATLTEAQFQEQVIELAHLYGWQHLHVRRSIGKGARWTTATNVVGWPDLFLWNETQHRTLAAELKTDKGNTTVEQLRVLRSLARAGVEIAVWRPRDFDDIQTVLSPRGAPRPLTGGDAA